MDDDMADIFNGVDDLVHITDEEPIDGSNFGDIFVPLEPVPLLTADYIFDLEWMKELTVEEPEHISSDFKNQVEEEQGTKNSSENAISSTTSSISDNSSCSGERYFLCSPGRTIPGKPRSKRSRLSFSRWASKSISPIASSVSENGSGCSTLPFSPIHAASWSQSGYFAYEQVECQSSLKFSAAKNMKKNEIKGVRKCTHCGVTKTPQWRCGPLGPKTLCNACGVRHKNGGLLPEYRPAASPTFSPGKHSNSHRKVLQIRHRKCLTGEKM